MSSFATSSSYPTSTPEDLQPLQKKVQELVEEYDLGDEYERLVSGSINTEEWEEAVKGKVQQVAVDWWQTEVLKGKKIGLFRAVKGRAWGVSEYLHGPLDRGGRVMVKFRSGNAGVNGGRARWEGASLSVVSWVR